MDWRLDVTELERLQHGARAIAHAELRKNRRRVVFHCPFGHRQRPGDLAVAVAARHQAQHFDLALGERLDAVRAGAKGYFLKDVSLERLTEGIREVARGGSIIRPAITERVLKGLEHVRREFDSLSPPDPLTKREVEILRLMAGGYSNREIAEALGTAEGTVKNHASSILSKLGVRDRTRAVLKALELGYI